MPKLHKASRRVLDEFDKAARVWGWEYTNGGVTRVGKAQKRYDFAKAALERRLAHLERKPKTRLVPSVYRVSEMP